MEKGQALCLRRKPEARETVADACERGVLVLAEGGVRQGGVPQTGEITRVVGEGVRVWHVPGQQRTPVICCSCSDATWKLERQVRSRL